MIIIIIIIRASVNMELSANRVLFLFIIIGYIYIAIAKHHFRHYYQDVRDPKAHHESVTGHRRGPKTDIRPNTVLSTDTDSVKVQTRLFVSPNYTVVQAQTGTTATLHCEVTDIGESTVSWIRRMDYHLLTVGLQTYSSDKRFFTRIGKNGQDWCLHIRYADSDDAGLYECQISTHPPSSLFVELQIVEAHADIVGGPDKIVKSGSPLILSCVLRRSTEEPEYIFWYHGEHMINYDLGGGAAVRHGRERSELVIPKADVQNAGNYSCVPSNARPASVTVHVLHSEKPAAMQHGSKNGSTRRFHIQMDLFGVVLMSHTILNVCR